MPVPRVALGDDGYTISRLLVGGWQLSRGHRDRGGSGDESTLFDDLERTARAGLTTFDCADIYTGVEECFGRFAATRGDDLRRDGIELQFHTKFVPDRGALATLDQRDVERAVDRSLARLGVERLELVQFAWWDYSVPGYVAAAQWLDQLRAAGKIRHVGVTNFDVVRVREMLDAGVPLCCNQVQYSVLDHRPEHGMAELATERGFGLLCYGTLAGGFLSERYFGVPSPSGELANRSLTKYRLIVDEFGGWELFQRLLAVLECIARRHAVAIPCVALRYVLDRSAVLGAIVGTYHGRHLDANLAVAGLQLSAADHAAIETVIRDASGPVGDVFELERIPDSPHARIMWTDLNREA